MRLSKKLAITLCGIGVLFPIVGMAETVDEKVVNTLWVLIAGAMVFLMQPGFALLESGMARSKNAVNVMMKNYMDICVGSLLFWLLGYGLMFGNSPTGWIGTDLFGLAKAPDWDFNLLFFSDNVRRHRRHYCEWGDG